MEYRELGLARRRGGGRASRAGWLVAVAVGLAGCHVGHPAPTTSARGTSADGPSGAPAAGSPVSPAAGQPAPPAAGSPVSPATGQPAPPSTPASAGALAGPPDGPPAPPSATPSLGPASGPGAGPAAPPPRALDQLRGGYPPSRLDAVAREAAVSASARHVVSASVVRAAMATAVGSGVWPHVLTAWGPEDDLAAQLAAGLSELRAVTEIAEVGVATAVGSAGRVGVVVAIPPPSLPIRVERAGKRARLTLPWRWGDGAAVYAVTHTESQRLAATRTGDQLALEIDCAAPSAIEIRAGARVIASVVDACAPVLAAGDPLPKLDLGPPARTMVEIEMRVWDLTNRERAVRGLPTLMWDPAAHRFARAHAADMARMREVSHAAPDGATYRERVATAPFRVRAARENVGRAWGPGEVHDAFLRSAGHRANLLADDIDRGAIGVAVDPADPTAFYISEFFRK